MKKSAIAIILNPEKTQVLLIKRRDVPIWVLPGGGIDDGETPSTAAIREAFEETGLHIAIDRQVALYRPVNKLTSDTYVFECYQLAGELSIGSETKEISFFSFDKLPSSFFFVHKEWLEDALRYEPAIICTYLKHITYSRLLLYFLRHPWHVLRFALSRCGYPLNTK